MARPSLITPNMFTIIAAKLLGRYPRIADALISQAMSWNQADRLADYIESIVGQTITSWTDPGLWRMGAIRHPVSHNFYTVTSELPGGIGR